ncbi:hypothetical protein F4808DRAFT_205016 [Astrocystis sublimbata]|nr:hypothetical protein F4808DRAFT_205016 [Astrocystis sublimbata]
MPGNDGSSSPDHKKVESGHGFAEGHDRSSPAAIDAQQKRKASSPVLSEDATPNSAKRPRIDSEKTGGRRASQSESAAAPSPDRREVARQEEKKRGKRLFGGLMSTLNQANAGAQRRKRPEIERRQQAKPVQQAKPAPQRPGDDPSRTQRLAKLEAVRKAEQLKFDEQVMKTIHADMRAKARYLQTKALPKIFYRPYEPTRPQQDKIEHQIEQVEVTIKNEISQFEERKQQHKQRRQSLDNAPKASSPEKHQTVGKSDEEPPTDKPPSAESTNDHPSNATNKVGPPDKEADKADLVMIEEDEDTVIY